MIFRYVLPHFEEAQYLMGTMLLSGQGERTSQIGCLRSCDLKGSLACYVSASLPGVEQNMAWAAHWFEQAAIIPSWNFKRWQIQSSAILMQSIPKHVSSSMKSIGYFPTGHDAIVADVAGSPSGTRRCSVQLGLDAPRRNSSVLRKKLWKVTSLRWRDFLGRTFPLFCPTLYIACVAFCWILVGKNTETRQRPTVDVGCLLQCSHKCWRIFHVFPWNHPIESRG